MLRFYEDASGDSKFIFRQGICDYVKSATLGRANYKRFVSHNSMARRAPVASINLGVLRVKNSK